MYFVLENKVSRGKSKTKSRLPTSPNLPNSYKYVREIQGWKKSQS